MTFAKAPIRTQRSAFLASETRVRFPDGHGDLRCRISGTFCRWRRRCSATKNKKMMWNSKAICCLSDQELCLHFGMHNVSAMTFQNARCAWPVVALLDDSRKSNGSKKRNSMSNERTNQQNQGGQQGGQQGGGQQGGQQNQTNKPGQGGQRQGGQQDR